MGSPCRWAGKCTGNITVPRTRNVILWGSWKKGIQKSTRKHRKYNTFPAENCPMNSLRSRTGSLPHPAIPWRTGWSGPQWWRNCRLYCTAFPQRNWLCLTNCSIWKRRSGKWPGCMLSHRIPSITGKTGFWTSWEKWWKNNQIFFYQDAVLVPYIMRGFGSLLRTLENNRVNLCS